MGRAAAGSRASKPDRTPPKMPSRILTIHRITQTVIANGSHTNRPVIRYFLKCTTIPVQTALGVLGVAGVLDAAGVSAGLADAGAASVGVAGLVSEDDTGGT